MTQRLTADDAPAFGTEVDATEDAGIAAEGLNVSKAMGVVVDTDPRERAVERGEGRGEAVDATEEKEGGDG